MNNIEKLKKLADKIDELETLPTSDAYWLKEQKVLEQRIKQNDEFKQFIQMSQSTYKRPFTI